MENSMKLELTIDEVNLIVNALAAQPFGTVYKLINKVQEQVKPQVEKKD
jgi:hypothetical protein